MSDFLTRIRREPALVRGAVASVALLFGVTVADVDLELIERAVVVGVPLIQGWRTRRRVTPEQVAERRAQAAAEAAALEAYRQIDVGGAP